jgi:predicted tellurium resistance membrane protein TerC
MWGSTIIIKWIERYPVIVTIGAAVLAWTASKMIVAEPFLHDYFTNAFLKYGFELIVVAVVIFAVLSKQKKNAQKVKEKLPEATAK